MQEKRSDDSEYREERATPPRAGTARTQLTITSERKNEMPNWCKNNLRIKGNGEKVLELLEMMKDEDGEMTFDKLVPEPIELKDTTSPTPDDVPQEERDRLKKLYGADNWYDWRCQNWGVKWNASESGFYKRGDDWIVSFQTPWGPPIEFLKRMSRQFSKITFILQFADETESGYPLGQDTFINGEECVEGPLEATPQAREFASLVWEEEWVDDWTKLKGKEEEDM